MRTIDLTRIDLSPKSLLMLIVGIFVLLVVIGIAYWAYRQVTQKIVPAAPVQKW